MAGAREQPPGAQSASQSIVSNKTAVLVLRLHRTHKLNNLREDPKPQGTLQP